METKANFVLIGAFTLGVVVAAFLFVMWIAGYGAAGIHRPYQLVFSGSVSGLSEGALVLFNGLKVGEVTHLAFDARDPSQVIADVDITKNAPINKDTKARLETQGLTGAAAVALIGGAKDAPALNGEDGKPPVIYAESSQFQNIIDNVQSLAVKADSVLQRADKLLGDNSAPITSAIANVNTFSKALADNSDGLDAALKGVADLGKTIQPLASRLQGLSDDADKLVRAIDAQKVRTIVDNVETMSGKANSVLDQAGKLISDNSDRVRMTIANASAFSKTLSDNAANVDAAMKSLGELGRNIQPVIQRVQGLADDADKVVKAIDADKVHGVVDNVDTFSRALSASSDNYQTLVRDGAALATRLNDTSKQLNAALADARNVLGAIDPKKVSGIVDSVSDVVTTVDQNRGNIDHTIKNASEMMAKLNESADKIDGLITSAQSFLGAPGTKGAMTQVGDAAQSIKKLSDDVDVRVKEISVGLNHFSNSGLREYESLAIEGRRVLDDVDRAVRSFERNPSQLIFGAKPSLPEYRGGQ
jgi:phospholipid/cholesterol/gamma-HCH transport system substrate-binding protein